MAAEPFPELTDLELVFPEAVRVDNRPPDPPLTEAELRFRHHCRADNPRARSVTAAYAAHCAETRARWEAAHQKTQRPKAAPKRHAPKAAPKYNQKWDPNPQKDS